MGLSFEKDERFDFSKLDEFIAKMTEESIFNASMAVVYKNKLVFRKNYGFRDYDKKTPASKDDLYVIYSSSKVITCTAAMRAIEDRFLSLDDPISKYIPEFKTMTVRDEKTGEVYTAQKQITVENLFTMSSGLTYELGNACIADYIRENPHANTLDVIKNGIAKMELIFEPGKHYNYSLSHDVLAGVVEVAVGEKFGDYVRRVIFEPLNMTDSTYLLSDVRDRSRLVNQYRDDPDKGIIREGGCIYMLTDRYESGGAGVITSTDDYVSFVSALSNYGTAKNGAHILSKESIDNMKTNRLTDEEKLEGFWKRCDGYGYGLGVRTLIDNKGTHAPIGEFGWDGAAATYTFVDVENNLCCFFGTQVLASTAALGAQGKMRDMIYEALGL